MGKRGLRWLMTARPTACGWSSGQAQRRQGRRSAASRYVRVQPRLMVEVEKAGDDAAGRRTDDARPRAQAATSCRRGGTARTQETEMDWNSAQVNWPQFRCEVHANWGR